MVVIRDEGSRFDGSVETVWRLRNLPEVHDRAHSSTRNRVMETIGPTTMMVRMERNWRGSWVRVATRETVLPPLGIVSEFLEGPFAGSKMITVYMPDGDNRHTRVDVVGDFKSPALPLEEVAPAALAWLEESFNEDAPAVRMLQGGKLDASVIEPETATQPGEASGETAAGSARKP